MHHLEVAYIDHDSNPEQQIYSAWFATFFIRMWSHFLKSDIKKQGKSDDAFKATMQSGYISSNLATGVEINGHAIIIYHNQCRELNRPELFVPSMINSQGVESTFRSLRSLSSTRSTIIDLDMLELIRRSSRLIILEDAPSELGDFLTPNKVLRTFIPTVLLSNGEVKAIVHNGSNDVGKSFKAFGNLI